jgi:hypothetical protein
VRVRQTGNLNVPRGGQPEGVSLSGRQPKRVSE